MPSDPSPQSTSSSGVFRLLLAATVARNADDRVVDLGGTSWILRCYDRFPSREDAPPFTCVSYAWGTGRAEHPFDADRTISNRAIPAALTAIAALGPEALWLDALCVPRDEPARGDCLRNMGAIYAAASQVVAVLAPPCAPLLDALRTNRRVDAAALLALESDDWISRAWTFQEMANSSKLLFIAEGSSGPAAGDGNFFSDLGGAIEKFMEAKGIDSFELRARHPKLDAFQEMIGYYYMGGYLDRTAFEVVSAMDLRSSERPDDYFEALLGALGEARDEAPGRRLQPAEQFMRLCEQKGDFSFIYCVAPRSRLAGECWRPLPGRMSAVLSWHSYGDGQRGSLAPTHLALEGVCRMARGTISDTAREYIETWLGRNPAAPRVDDVVESSLALLRKAGFSGTGGCIELEGGYFFPQTPVADTDVIVVATGVRWRHGAPGLVLEGGDGPVRHLRDVGAFVGPVPETGETINLGA